MGPAGSGRATPPALAVNSSPTKFKTHTYGIWSKDMIPSKTNDRPHCYGSFLAKKTSLQHQHPKHVSFVSHVSFEVGPTFRPELTLPLSLGCSQTSWNQ